MKACLRMPVLGGPDTPNVVEAHAWWIVPGSRAESDGLRSWPSSEWVSADLLGQRRHSWAHELRIGDLRVAGASRAC